MTVQCPPGYCQCRVGALGPNTEECLPVFSETDRDSQCVCDRKGKHVWVVIEKCIYGKTASTVCAHLYACIFV